ncbi:BTAD domain-containing putative transcriptional regulator [Streptosporangium sp. NPDC049644]|uniref:ATP-binding protein n=1 Tax=Streptosporangium sp. NPDC049644 TaxID=3155507 RepID=UPI00344462AF
MEVAVSTLPITADARACPVPGTALRMQILGPLRLWRGDVELDAGPRQQAHLLALLLAHEGLPISKVELIDLIWGKQAPGSAVNAIHKYIGALRRLLEPDLPARGSSSYLLSRGSGYLCTAGAGTLDLATFRELVRIARSALEQDRRERALDCYERALRLWRGPAGDGLALEPEALPVFAGLNGEFFNACSAAAGLAVSLGRPERVLVPLQLAASMEPLHEPVQAGLISVLGAAGRQAEALSAFRAVRSRLAEDLGIDPGPVLEQAYQRVLRQDLTSMSTVVTSRDENLRSSAASAPSATGDGLVGRSEELAVLREATRRAVDGRAGLVLIEGEPGVGKTRLMEEAAREAGDRDGLVVWGRCLEDGGAPSMWPWVHVVRAVLDGVAAPERERWLKGALGRFLEPHDDALTGQVLPGGSGRFHLFEKVIALIAHVSARRPVMVVVDDLQWADVASLHLFGHLASRLPTGTVLLGALRDRAPVPGSELARMLAEASRSSGHHRLVLGPLGSLEVAELVRREIGRAPGLDAARAIHSRTAGNPFFVRELARLLAGGSPLAEDAAARAGVPSTVRGVVRDRMTGLDDDAKDLLEIAALVGRDVDLSLLARVADLDIATCLVRLESVEALGLLAPTPGDPYSFRFVHDLVRESISETTSPRRATRLHLRVANALEQSLPDGESVPEQVAHHLWAAGPLAAPARTAAALARSGRRAAARSALEAAEQQLRLSAQVARSAGLVEPELAALSQLTAVIGMRSMYAGAELNLLERAEHLARVLGREVEAAGILYSRWAALAQGIELDRSGPLARQLLQQGESSPHPIVRTYGLQAWGIHQWDIGNIGEAYRHLSRSGQTLLAGSADREDAPVQHDLQLLMTGMLAEATALYGDVAGAHTLLDRLEAAGDDRYTVTVWATMSARTAAIVGDPAAALRSAERGIAVDPDFSYVFLGTYQRLARCWARAVTGDDPTGAATQAERIIETNLLNPVRSCVSTWYALLGEMRLAAGEPQKAAAALDRADHYLRAYGQRYQEGLLLLLHARLLRAQGKPRVMVRAAAEQARRLSAEREAHLFVQRADTFLARLDGTPSGR